MKRTLTSITVKAIMLLAVTVCSHQLSAAEETIMGVPTERLAEFAYPGVPVDTAIEQFRNEYYENEDELNTIYRAYTAFVEELATDIAYTSDLHSEEVNALKQDPYALELALNNSAKLTRTKYTAAQLNWNDSLTTTPFGKLFAEVNASSMNKVLHAFDMDLVKTKTVDYLILSQYGFCNMDPIVRVACINGGVPRGSVKPYPYMRSQMWSAAQNTRQAAIASPPDRRELSPDESRGLYEAARHYKTTVNQNSKLLMGLASNINDFKGNNISRVVTELVNYLELWGFAGVAVDDPRMNPLGLYDDSVRFIQELRKAKPELVIVYNLYNSHQINDDAKDFLSKIKDDVTYFRAFLNSSLSDDEIGQYAPYDNLKGVSYTTILKKFADMGIPAAKIIQEIRAVSDARYYSELVEPWVGGEDSSRMLMSGKAIPNVDKERPGTFTPGQYLQYDIDSMSPSLVKRADPTTTNQYYLNDNEKFIITGEDEYSALLKTGTSKMHGVNAAFVRLDHENGKLSNAINRGFIAAGHDSFTFTGEQLTLPDTLGMHRYATKGHWLIKPTDAVKVTNKQDTWCVDKNDWSAASQVVVTVADEAGKTHSFNLLVARYNPNQGLYSPVGNQCHLTGMLANDDLKRRITMPVLIKAGDNSHLNAGHYKSIESMELELKQWHNVPFPVPKLTNVNIDVVVP